PRHHRPRDRRRVGRWQAHPGHPRRPARVRLHRELTCWCACATPAAAIAQSPRSRRANAVVWAPSTLSAVEPRNGGFMSTPRSCVTTLQAAALAGVFLLAAGCGNKKSENKEGQAASASAPLVSEKSGTPGVTATEIKIGQSTTYSGPASAYGV